MSLQELYDDFRAQFPELTDLADRRHEEIWDRVERRASFVWFESLAQAMNARMGRRVGEVDFHSVFVFFDKRFRGGDDQERECIDVSFVENLFWQVPPDNAEAIWALLPQSLQQLYIRFHGRPPA